MPRSYSLIHTARLPDHLHVTHDLYDPENPVAAKHGQVPVHSEGWRLCLTAFSMEEPERLVRFLTGALLACGGWVLTRITLRDQPAELEFEFARAACLEIYAVLVAAGLELSRDSHLQLAEFCHCTRNVVETRAFEIARIDLAIYRSTLKSGGTETGSRAA